MPASPPKDPKDFTDQTWPYGLFKAGSAEEEPWKHAAQQLGGVVVQLQRLMRERGTSIRHLSRTSGVDRGSIDAILAGESWPDFATVGRLLWVLDRHLVVSRKPPYPPFRR